MLGQITLYNFVIVCIRDAKILNRVKLCSIIGVMVEHFGATRGHYK